MADLAIHLRQGYVHVQDAQQALLLAVGMAGGRGAGRLVGDGIDEPQHARSVRGAEGPGTGLDLQALQGTPLGVAGVAGLAPDIQAGADLLLRRGEHDAAFLVEHPDLPDALPVKAAHRPDLTVQVLPAVLQHVEVGGALDGLAELIGTAGALGQELGRVGAEDGEGHAADHHRGREAGAQDEPRADAGAHA